MLEGLKTNKPAMPTTIRACHDAKRGIYLSIVVDGIYEEKRLSKQAAWGLVRDLMKGIEYETS